MPLQLSLNTGHGSHSKASRLSTAFSKMPVIRKKWPQFAWYQMNFWPAENLDWTVNFIHTKPFKLYFCSVHTKVKSWTGLHFNFIQWFHHLPMQPTWANPKQCLPAEFPHIHSTSFLLYNDNIIWTVIVFTQHLSGFLLLQLKIWAWFGHSDFRMARHLNFHMVSVVPCEHNTNLSRTL